MALFNLETFHALIICKHTLSTIIAILMLVWLHKYRGGFGWESLPFLEFNWHPFLMFAGMIVLNSNAILAYRMFRTMKKYNAKWIHGAVQVCGFFFTVVGLKAVFDSHNLVTPPIPNMYTLHSWIGILAVAMFFVQWVAGLLIFAYPGGDAELRENYHRVHIYWGVICFWLSVCAAMLGLLEKAIFAIKDYSSFSAEGILVNTIGIILFLYSTLAFYMVMESSYKRPSAEEDQALLEIESKKRMSISKIKMK